MENTLPPPETVPLAYPTIKESWGAFGWHLLIMIIMAIVVALVLPFVPHTAAQFRLWIWSGASEVGLILTILWLRRRAGPTRWLGLVLQETPVRWPLYALLPAIVLAQALLLTVLSLLHLPNWFAETFRDIAKYPVLLAVTGCVLAPILEESFFRGILLKGLLRNYSPAVAIGQSALLFGLVHFNPAQSVNAVLIGALLGWLYYRTHSLGLCIGLHALNNVLAFGYLHTKGSQSHPTTLGFTNWPQYWLMLAVAGAVLGSILWWVQRSTTPIPTLTRENQELTPEIA